MVPLRAVWFRGINFGSAVCTKILRGRIFGSAVGCMARRMLAINISFLARLSSQQDGLTSSK